MTDLSIDTGSGEIAIRDYGGQGRDVLMVHGTGHNLEVWNPQADRLKTACRLGAFDVRDHGLTKVDSTDAVQYWKDIDREIKELVINPVLLVGHATGGFSVAAYTV